MENPNKSNRKRHSSTIKLCNVETEKKKMILSTSLKSKSNTLLHSTKLIDHLFQTWQNANDPARPACSSQKDQISQASKNLTSKLAVVKLKKTSLDLKLSELKSEKAKFFKAHMQMHSEDKFNAQLLDDARELIELIYDDIMCMLETEASFDQHLNNFLEMRSQILQKLQENYDKLEDIPNETEYIVTEINIEKDKLDKLIYTLNKLKEEDEKLKDSDQGLSFDDLEKSLENTKMYINKLTEEEIGLESDLQMKNDKNYEHNCKYSQDLQEIEEELRTLEIQLKSYDTLDELVTIIASKIKKITEVEYCLDSSIQAEFTEEIKNIKDEIKKLEQKADLVEKYMMTVKCLSPLETELIEIKKETDLILMENTCIKNLDNLLAEVNKELELLHKEQIADEIQLKNQNLENLIREQAVVDQENTEILRDRDEYSNYNEEEQLFCNLKLDLENKTLMHNEIMTNIKKMKDVNSEHLENNPTLLDPKDYTDFEKMKKNAEATLDSARKNATIMGKKAEIKLKLLKNKAEKYSTSLKEINQEISSGEKTFSHLEKQIEVAEKLLEKKKEPIQKKAKPVIIKNELVQVDMETLSLTKSLSWNILEKNFIPFSADNEASNKGFLFSQAVRQKSFSQNQKSEEDVYSFSEERTLAENSSQKSFQELLSQFGSQKSNQSVPSPSKEKSKREKSSDVPKLENKEHQIVAEKKFFKSPSNSPVVKKQKRSKSVPPRKH